MFSRDRVCQFAVRGWLITGVLCLVALPALGQSDNPESSAPSKEATTEQGQPTVEPPAAAAPAPVKVPKQKAASPEQKALCDSPQTPKENDLCQQWRMAEAAEKQAKWTEFQFKATLAEIVALILTVIFTACAAIAAVIAARAAQSTVDVAVSIERPILEVIDVTIGNPHHRYESQEQRLRDGLLTVSVENYGKTPAFIDHCVINAAICLTLPKEGFIWPTYPKGTKYLPHAWLTGPRPLKPGEKDQFNPDSPDGLPF